MYVIIKDGKAQPYSLGQLRSDNPQTSFPQSPTNSLLAEFGVYPARVLESPEYDSNTHELVLSDFQQIGQEWVAQYVEKPLPQSSAESNVRSKRDALLAECDWVVVKAYEQGLSVPANWALYRQSLRDVPSQSGFPYAVSWPAKP